MVSKSTKKFQEHDKHFPFLRIYYSEPSPQQVHIRYWSVKTGCTSWSCFIRSRAVFFYSKDWIKICWYLHLKIPFAFWSSDAGFPKLWHPASPGRWTIKYLYNKTINISGTVQLFKRIFYFLLEIKNFYIVNIKTFILKTFNIGNFNYFLIRNKTTKIISWALSFVRYLV